MDLLFGFNIIPPTVMRHFDLTALSNKFQQLVDAGYTQFQDDLTTVLSVIKRPLPHVAKEWKRTDSTVVDMSCTLVYPHDFTPMSFLTIEQQRRMRPSDHPELITNTYPSLAHEQLNFLVLHYLIECPLSYHNMFMDVNHTAILGIDNDRCPFHYPKQRLPLAVQRPCNSLRQSVYKRMVKASKKGGQQTACSKLLADLHTNDPIASAWVDDVVHGKVIPASLSPKYRPHKHKQAEADMKSPLRSFLNCDLAANVARVVDAIGKHCEGNEAISTAKLLRHIMASQPAA